MDEESRMVRSMTLIATLSLALTPLAWAADAPPPDVVAKIQQAALKSCNHDLDADHFDWSSIDECVSYKTTKMEGDYSKQGAPRAH